MRKEKICVKRALDLLDRSLASCMDTVYCPPRNKAIRTRGVDDATRSAKWNKFQPFVRFFYFPPIRAPPFVKAVDSGNSPLSISMFLAALRSCSESDYKRHRARYDSFPYFQMFRFRKKRLFSVTGEESTSYTAQRYSTDDKTRGGVSFPICIHGRYVSFRSIRVEWRENSGRHCGANRAPRRLNTPPLFPTYSNARSRNLDTGYLHLDPGKAFESIR